MFFFWGVSPRQRRFFPSFFWCPVDHQRFLLLLPPVKRSESNVSAGRCPKHFDHFFLPHKRKESLLKMSHDKHPESMCQDVQKTPWWVNQKVPGFKCFVP